MTLEKTLYVLRVGAKALKILTLLSLGILLIVWVRYALITFGAIE